MIVIRHEVGPFHQAGRQNDQTNLIHLSRVWSAPSDVNTAPPRPNQPAGIITSRNPFISALLHRRISLESCLISLSSHPLLTLNR